MISDVAEFLPKYLCMAMTLPSPKAHLQQQWISDSGRVFHLDPGLLLGADNVPCLRREVRFNGLFQLFLSLAEGLT